MPWSAGALLSLSSSPSFTLMPQGPQCAPGPLPASALLAEKTSASRPQRRLCSYLFCVLYSLVKCVRAARGLIPRALLAGVQQAGSTAVIPKKSRAPEPCDSSAPLDCAGKFLRLSGSICHHSIPARIPRQEVSSQSSVHFCACLCKTIQQPSKSHPPLARGCIVAQPSAPSYA